jgi:hypothetical protein
MLITGRVKPSGAAFPLSVCCEEHDDATHQSPSYVPFIGDSLRTRVARQRTQQ